jgi:hypothetical protein
MEHATYRISKSIFGVCILENIITHIITMYIDIEIYIEMYIDIHIEIAYLSPPVTCFPQRI